MTKMYDSALGTIPSLPNGGAGADILIPTDGKWFANGQKMKAANPNARVHTISEVGAVVAEWIDVEVGCVWPPATAVTLWHEWRTKGCKGFYCSISLQPTIRTLLAADDNPEWFDANYTGVDHVDPGDEATQYANPGPYDISETTPAFEATAPDPPTPQEVLETMLIGNDHNGNLIVVGPAKDNGNLLVFTLNPTGHWSVMDVTDAIKGVNPADPRTYAVV